MYNKLDGKINRLISESLARYIKTYDFLIPLGDNLFCFLDRNGDRHLAYKLLGDETSIPKFYTIGSDKIVPELIIRDKNIEEIFFRDEKGEISIENLLSSQLKGNGQYVYYLDMGNERIDIGDKSALPILIKKDLTLKHVHLRLQASLQK